MTFQLDTTGYVQCPAPDQKPNESTGCWFWSDLTPFAQGYTEPVLREVGAAFHMLAPETLARIIADCESQSSVYTDRKPDHTDGRIFWSGRQNGVLRHRGFPPLTVSLNDAGKVVFS